MEYMKLAALLLAATAAFFDLRTEKIPNWLTFSGFLAGIGLSCLLFPDGFIQGFLGSLLGAGLPFLLLFLPFCLRMIGAGDVKLLMALGAFAGWPGILHLLLGTLICGSAFSAGIMAGRTGFRPRVFYFLQYMRCLFSGIVEPYRQEETKSANMHFAVPVLFGTIFWLLRNA
ncbi:MAG: A24 family peptidase [Lachnospiraceae bacterium]